MRKLTFPTMAEQCLTKFEESTVTISINTIAQEMEADRDDSEAPDIIWTFDDDTSLVIKGRGKNHRTFVRLP